MPFISIPNTVLVRLFVKTAVAELKASVSLYFAREDFSYNDMTDLLDDLEADFVADLMTPLDSNYNAYLLEAYDMRTQDGWKVTHVLDIDGGGSVMDTPLSPALCCVVSFHGDKRGKWNAGRNYVAGISEQDADQVDITQGVVDQIRGAYEGLINDPPAGWAWVVASRYLNKTPRAIAVTAPVTGCLVRSNRFGFQRRRAQRT